MESKAVVGKDVFLAIIPIKDVHEKYLFSPQMLSLNPPDLNVLLFDAPILQSDISLESVEKLLQGKG